MAEIIYVDMLFFINALIGYFLLRAAALIAGCMISSGRILIGAAAAGLSSFILLMPPVPEWLMWGSKIGCAFLIVFISFPVCSVRGFLKCGFWYAVLNLLLSGIVFAVSYYTGTENIRINNLSVYFNISPFLLIGCITGMYLLLSFGTRWLGKPARDITVPIRMQFDDGVISGNALLDTGFSLTDPNTGMQAILISYPQLRNKLPLSIIHKLSLYFDEGILETGGRPVCLVPVCTAAGMRVMPSFRMKELTICNSAVPRRLKEISAVFTPEILADGTFTAIIPADFGK